MGYTTTFEGSFAVTPALSPMHADYVRDFSSSRRLKRDPVLAALVDDPVSSRARCGLPIGPEGAYMARPGRDGFGQEHDHSVIDYNNPPEGQPGLWCNWTASDDGAAIEWARAGAAIRAERLEAGLTLRKFAAQCCISPTALSLIEQELKPSNIRRTT